MRGTICLRANDEVEEEEGEGERVSGQSADAPMASRIYHIESTSQSSLPSGNTVTVRDDPPDRRGMWLPASLTFENVQAYPAELVLGRWPCVRNRAGVNIPCATESARPAMPAATMSSLPL